MRGEGGKNRRDGTQTKMMRYISTNMFPYHIVSLPPPLLHLLLPRCSKSGIFDRSCSGHIAKESYPAELIQVVVEYMLDALWMRSIQEAHRCQSSTDIGWVEVKKGKTSDPSPCPDGSSRGKGSM